MSSRAKIADRESGALVQIPVDGVDPLRAQCGHFVACVRRGDVIGGNGARARNVVRVLEAVTPSIPAGGK